eukprot:TRINITY_DN4545_c0_g1_i1.p1 TRINITY_DN4545_c0_g1~~TRINITY_DN4545_c0_g1_i1.p1  ORF type:complete len:2281 (-),score=531.88 TRINITY_DN4545_c0_g1_i1:432-6551(-)
MSALTKLGLSSNAFTGGLPLSFTNLTNLSDLNLGNNRLVGTIPALYSLLRVSSIQLQGNALIGTIPFGSTNSLLRIINVANNKLNGTLPLLLSALSLVSLDVSNNTLSGTIPAYLNSQLNLTTLNLCYNNMSGFVPSAIFSFPHQSLCLSNNSFDGIACPSPTLNCTGCGQGYYALAVNNRPPDTCQICPAGTYTSAYTATACSSCIVGTFAASPASSQCTTCVPSTYANVTAQRVPCYSCPINHRTLRYGSNDSSECIPAFIASVNPASGPAIGKQIVTIAGTNLALNLADVVAVFLTNVSANIVSVTTAQIVVVSSSPATPTGGSVMIVSRHFGNITLPNGYTYHAQGVIDFLWPQLGPLAGTQLVSVYGRNLGSGSDLFLATVAGVQATIVFQSATEVVLRTGASSVRTGVVCLNTSTYGNTVSSIAYTYSAAIQIHSIDPPMGPSAGGQLVTITGINLSTGTEVLSVTLAGVNATAIVSQDPTRIVVRSAPSGVISGNVVVQASYGTLTVLAAYQYNPSGVITGVVPNRGPISGDNLVTVTGTDLCNGTDVLYAVFGSAVASVVSQSSSVVVVQMGAANAPGAVTFSLVSVTFGTTFSSLTYQFNLPPAVFWFSPVLSTMNAVERTLVVVGQNLGSGTDITSVIVADVEATIVSQNQSAVVVQIGTPFRPVTGPVVVISTSFGISTSSANFTYLGALNVGQTPGLTQVEGTDISFSVSLTGPPTADVTVSVTTLACSVQYLRAAPIALLFNSTTWSQTQRVALTVDNDYIASPSQQCLVRFGPVVTTDASFVGASVDRTVLLIDDDVAGFVFTPVDFFNIGADLGMFEGISGRFGMRLSSEPLAPVLVQSTPALAAKLFSNTTLFSFTAQNWNITQLVAVESISDNTVSGVQWSGFRMCPTSSDALYNGAGKCKTANIAVVDTDGVFVVQFAPALSNTTEDAGQTIIYGILVKQLVSSITCFATISDENEATIAPGIKTILPTMLNIPMAFTITGKRDWVVDGPQAIVAQFAITGPGVTEMDNVQLYNVDVDYAALNVSKSLLVVNETGARDIMLVQPNSIPTEPLTFRCVSDNTSIVTVTPSTFTFTADNWNVPVAVVASGVRNPSSVATDGQANVYMSYSSGESAYASITVSVSVLNRDIHWPNAVAVVPEVVPLIGLNITIYGGDFQPGIVVSIAGYECINVSIVRVDLLTCVTPPINVTSGTYQDVVLQNTDGGYQFMNGSVFFTDDCPQPGSFGRGLGCTGCPAGAYCPGGYRLWPLAGWFAFSETDGRVYECNPATACVGGRYSECANGYTGALCSACADGFYRSSGQCNPCSSQATIGALLTVQFSFIVLFMIAGLVVSEVTLGNVAYVIGCMRGLWIATSNLSGLPGVAQQVLNVLSLFSADLSFSQPGCTGVNGFLSIYTLNLSVVVGAGLVLFALVTVKHVISTSRAAKHIQAHGGTDLDEALVRKIFGMHATRVMFTYAMYVYAILFSKSFQSLNCVAYEGAAGTVISVDVLTPCYSASHIAAMVISILLLLFILALPVMAALLSHWSKYGSKYPTVFKGIIVATVDEFAGPTMYWANCILVLADVLLGALSEFIPASAGATAGQIIALSIPLLFVAIFRPFDDTFKNFGSCMLYCASILAVVAGEVADSAVDAALGYCVVALMCGYLLMLVGLLLSHFIRERVRRLRIDVMAREQRMTEEIAAEQAAARARRSSRRKSSGSVYQFEDNRLRQMHQAEIEAAEAELLAKRKLSAIDGSAVVERPRVKFADHESESATERDAETASADTTSSEARQREGGDDNDAENSGSAPYMELSATTAAAAATDEATDTDADVSEKSEKSQDVHHVTRLLSRRLSTARGLPMPEDFAATGSDISVTGVSLSRLPPLSPPQLPDALRRMSTMGLLQPPDSDEETESIHQPAIPEDLQQRMFAPVIPNATTASSAAVVVVDERKQQRHVSVKKMLSRRDTAQSDPVQQPGESQQLLAGDGAARVPTAVGVPSSGLSRTLTMLTGGRPKVLPPLHRSISNVPLQAFPSHLPDDEQ